MSSHSYGGYFFLGGGGGVPTRIFFLTTILLLKVAKRWLFVKKMSLEPYFSSGTRVITIFRHERTFKDLHGLENPHIGLQDLKFG